MSEWRSWTYDDWNRRLLEHCFYVRPGRDGQPIERIPATPEELRQVTGDHETDSYELAEAFADRMVAELPYREKNLCSFSTPREGWTPESSDPPHFFAMLWLTCLISSGFPKEGHAFHDRARNVFGRRQNFSCLPELWDLLARWIERRIEAGNARFSGPLVLPPHDEYRSVIGPSWFLAFPHLYDRETLRRLFEEHDLVGDEPPLMPVLRILQDNRDEFSSSFLEDLDNFRERFVVTSRDTRRSAFWRAIRQEALYPVSDSQEARSVGKYEVMAFVTDESRLFVYLACTEDAQVPEGYAKEELDFTIDGFTHYVVDTDGDHDESSAVTDVIRAILDGQFSVPRATKHAQRGVLVFQEVTTGYLRLSGGEEARGAEVTLVREDLVDAFQREHGGTAYPSYWHGWRDVLGCDVEITRDPAPGLERVLHLQSTMPPLQIRFVGGIRLSDGFLALPGFLPRVRFEEAERVVIEDEETGESWQATRLDDRDWKLPDELEEASIEGRREYEVGIRWHPRDEEEGDESRIENRLTLVGVHVHVDTKYKGLPKGRYFYEGITPGERELVDDKFVPLHVEAAPVGDPDESGPELATLEPDRRFAGPIVGQFDLTYRSGFDWLVTGPKNHPDLTMFVGDPHEPPLPREDVQCSQQGTRRHWRCAFIDSKSVVVRLQDGAVVPVEDVPPVYEVLRRYRYVARNPSNDIPTIDCDTFDVDIPVPWSGMEPRREVDALVDALAALSTSRSGVRYGIVLEMLATQLGCDLDGGVSVLHQIIRAWVEAGCLDVVHAQGRSATYLLARRPRFVAYRIGGWTRAALIGLVPSFTRKTIVREAERLKLPHGFLLPTCEWAPGVFRLERVHEKELVELSEEFDFESPRWLRWPENEENLFDPLRQGLREDAPPLSFRTKSLWKWREGRFGYVPDDTTPSRGIVIEKRTSAQRCPIYVVLEDGEPLVWTYIRNWAVLYAYRAGEGRLPFDGGGDAPLARSYDASVNLPIVAGRYCAVLGDALAGPVVERRDTSYAVSGYYYPLGVSRLRVLRSTFGLEQERLRTEVAT